MFKVSLELLEMSFYSPKNQYSRLEQILLSVTIATRHCSNPLGTVAQLNTVATQHCSK